ASPVPVADTRIPITGSDAPYLPPLPHVKTSVSSLSSRRPPVEPLKLPEDGQGPPPPPLPPLATQAQRTGQAVTFAASIVSGDRHTGPPAVTHVRTSLNAGEREQISNLERARRRRVQ
ncbi:unnamed protein product, partial [Polarella glacialis]